MLSRCKAMNILYHNLNIDEFSGFNMPNNKEIWDMLEITYEGTNQVKESKLNFLERKY